MNFRGKRDFKTREKILDRKHYKIAILVICAFVAYNSIFNPKYIGSDIRYGLFIVTIPVIVGTVAFGFYRRNALKTYWGSMKSLRVKTFSLCFLLIQGALASFFSFGFIAKVAWDFANAMSVKSSETETLKCNVTRFWSKKNCSVDFKLFGEHEQFSTSYQFIKEYENENPDRFYLDIKAKKGIWGYYLVDDWTIRAK